MKIPDMQKQLNAQWITFLSQDLDAFFLATNAPGKSAFNRVERRTVKFSKELSGVVLHHDNFGSHLNAKGETNDKELEKKFRVCWGDTTKIWSGMITDGHPVLAEFISEEVDQEVVKKSEEWKINTFANHNIFCKSF